MERIYHKWIMYHEIHKQYRNGLTPAQIASYLVMDTRTVKKLLAMSEKEYMDFQELRRVLSKVSVLPLH